VSALAKRNPEIELAEDLGGFTHDPLRFVLYAFPWGVAGTELADHEGPREWQRKILQDIGAALKAGASTQEAIRIAVASGHGVGKSAIVAWIILWALATCRDTKVLLTANTEPQLRTKTWPEVSKWFRLLICAHWFKLTATSIFSANPKHEKTWRADYVTWSENNTEAFAGLHNKGRRIVLLFDEASAIARLVWEVAEGALTDEDTEIIWAVFGNPTQNTGRFRECFGKFRHRWRVAQIDSRTVPGTNKTQLAQWVDDYGEDSDFVRVRVKGEFPRAAAEQFIGHDVVDAAKKRTPEGYEKGAKAMGVDVARFGDDQTVILLRQGQAILHIRRFRNLDTMQTAARVIELAEEWEPHGIFVDGVGVGGGVVDRLRQLGRKVIEVNNGASAIDEKQFMNVRAETWSAMREWLKKGGCLPPDDAELDADLTSPEYYFDAKQRLALERKEDMKKRGLASPDAADALALTFAARLAPPAQADRWRVDSVRSSSWVTA
jgi:hypothetical protein